MGRNESATDSEKDATGNKEWDVVADDRDQPASYDEGDDIGLISSWRPLLYSGNSER